MAIEDYGLKATEARKGVLEMLHRAQKSHIGSCFSCIDILTVVFDRLTDDDRIIMGKGWAAAAMYWFLADHGTIPASDLKKFCKDDEKAYIGLLEPSVKGVLHATGSVGMGLPFAVGHALAKRLKGEPGKVYVIEGDGALQTGIFWESMMQATHYGLDNLVLLIDNNRLQAMGHSVGILNVEPLDMKFRAFGWRTESIDGHNFHELGRSICSDCAYKPHAIICRTVKGKGVSFMEDAVEWHYRAPDDEEFKSAMKELDDRAA